ncbi:MAG: SRPBCC domain-containing protein, partial [Alcanivorax sp.]|nr:SRPBCC domain-containing protein [Alcanivorax sp.]
MLKRYFIDEVTETRASRRQAFSLFSQVNGWADWCSVVHHARLFGGEWREGAALLF